MEEKKQIFFSKLLPKEGCLSKGGRICRTLSSFKISHKSQRCNIYNCPRFTEMLLSGKVNVLSYFLAHMGTIRLAHAGTQSTQLTEFFKKIIRKRYVIDLVDLCKGCTKAHIVIVFETSGKVNRRLFIAFFHVASHWRMVVVSILQENKNAFNNLQEKLKKNFF